MNGRSVVRSVGGTARHFPNEIYFHVVAACVNDDDAKDVAEQLLFFVLFIIREDL